MSEGSEAKAQDAVHDAAPGYRAVFADTNQDAVPPGYKRTEVGVIPEDWGIKTLAHFVSNLRAGVSVNSITSDLAGDVPCVLKTSCIQAGAFFPTEAKVISPKDRTRVGVTPKAGAILISRMNTIDLVGESGFVCADYENLFLPDRIWMTVFNRHVRFSSRWLAFVLSSPAYRRHLKEIATGTSGSMKNIAKWSLLQLTVPQPSESEQRAIATALSDTDALIESLDRLIAKKRAIKQAAMQQLLTGQTRLPGFTGEWATKKQLGDLGRWCGGLTPSMANESYWEGGTIPWLSSSDVRQGFIADLSGKVTEKALKDTAISLMPKDSVIVVTRSGILRRYFPVARTSTPVVINQDLRALPPGPHHDPRFLTQALLAFGYRIRMDCMKAGTTVESIDSVWFRGFEIDLPSLEEQRAIATVLSDMDAEIEVLERRRDKASQIKQGMMQQLLTGRVRLPLDEYEDVA